MKKVLSLILAAVCAITLLAGCNKGPDLSYAATGTLNGEEQKFSAGPYRFYVQWMNDYYYSYFTTMAAQMEKKITWTDMLADTSLTSPKTLSQYIVDNAKEQYMAYLYIDNTFRELGLELTAEDEKQIDSMIQKDFISVYGNDGFNTIRQTLGMSYEEIRNLSANSIKEKKIVEYYYGEGGPNAVSEQEKKDYYAKNYVRFKYVILMTMDSKGDKYNDTKMAEINAAKDAILAALEGGTATFEDLIKQYSEDYTEITDKMTESEKESYTKQNDSMVNDGLVINDEGIFSEALATYYNITVDDAIVDKVFALRDGEYATVTIDDSIWIVKRYDNGEKEEYYEGVKDTVFNALYSDDLAAKHTAWRSKLNYQFNEDLVNACKPENLGILFTTNKS